jgi:AcrR family transcriptional regulator
MKGQQGLSDKKQKEDVIKARRGQLTRAAYMVVGEKGYYNITVRDIARKAGLSTGLVHYYFKDKQELLLTLLKEMNKKLSTSLAEALKGTDDPEGKLGIYLDQALGLVMKEKEYFPVLFDFWTQISRNRRMRKANIKLFQSYRDECAVILREGIESGVFREMDVEYITTYIVSLVQGIIIQYIIGNNAFDYRDYTGRMKSEIMKMVKKH